jgi:hypothetical protein
MGEFIAFAAIIALAVGAMVMGPIFLHPTLPAKHKSALAAVAFMLLIPAGICLYCWLGVPQMANVS